MLIRLHNTRLFFYMKIAQMYFMFKNIDINSLYIINYSLLNKSDNV